MILEPIQKGDTIYPFTDSPFVVCLKNTREGPRLTTSHRKASRSESEAYQELVAAFGPLEVVASVPRITAL